MPRLSAMPRPPAPAEGYELAPIPPDYDRHYILDEAGLPVRVYDYGVLARWESFEGKAFQIRDMLPEYGVEVWTYFSGWGSLRDDAPPVFRTMVKGPLLDKAFHSLTWEEAEDKHRRVIEKVRRTMSPKPGVSDGA